MADVWICEPGWEPAMEAERQRTPPACRATSNAPGCVISEPSATDVEPAVAFAAQCLPDAAATHAESIANWSATACSRIVERLDAVPVPWRLHVVSTPFPDGTTGVRRTKLVRERITADLCATKRRLAKRLVADDEPAWQDDEALVQVLLTSPTTGFTSIADAAVRRRMRRCLSRFAGGRVEPAVDKRAPSRAFAKLVEVERRLARPIARGETCVDLGSAPGSWAYTALKRGARVTAVDRSPLRADLMRHRQLTFVRGDAFRYVPDAPVDWLLSDVIAFPGRIRELLGEWLNNRRCRFFCVTIKFRGRDDDAELESVKRLLAESDYEFCVRRLNANKNEATAYGFLRDDDTKNPPLC